MKKGQYFTLEQMLLFSIGIMITTFTYLSLVTVNESIKTMTEEDQMYEISDLVSSGITRVYLSPKETSLIFDIPKKISETGYKIYIENNENLTINHKDKKIKILLNDEYKVSGMLFSSSGKIRIRKFEDEITIGRY